MIAPDPRPTRGIPDPGGVSGTFRALERTAPGFRSVCQFTGEKVIAPPLPRGPKVASAPAPCGLPRHDPGRRVTFRQWDNDRDEMVTHAGIVLTHVDRTVTIRTDAGAEVWTSCGHVVAAR